MEQVNQLARYFDLFRDARARRARLEAMAETSPHEVRTPVGAHGEIASAPPASDGEATAIALEEVSDRTRSPWWLAAQYIALFLGVLAKAFVDSVNGGDDAVFSLTRMIVALIVATAVFPGVYRKALDSDDPGFVQLCVIFAAGLGYKTLVDIPV